MVLWMENINHNGSIRRKMIDKEISKKKTTVENGLRIERRGIERRLNI